MISRLRFRELRSDSYAHKTSTPIGLLSFADPEVDDIVYSKLFDLSIEYKRGKFVFRTEPTVEHRVAEDLEMMDYWIGPPTSTWDIPKMEQVSEQMEATVLGATRSYLRFLLPTTPVEQAIAFVTDALQRTRYEEEAYFNSHGSGHDGYAGVYDYLPGKRTHDTKNRVVRVKVVPGSIRAGKCSETNVHEWGPYHHHAFYDQLGEGTRFSQCDPRLKEMVAMIPERAAGSPLDYVSFLSKPAADLVKSLETDENFQKITPLERFMLLRRCVSVDGISAELESLSRHGRLVEDTANGRYPNSPIYPGGRK